MHDAATKLRILITGSWRTQAIYVAAKLQLADHVAAGKKTADELAAATGTHAPSLYRLLRALASNGIFAEQADRSFELTPLADCLRSDHPSRLNSLATMLGEEHYICYGQLLEGVRTGEIVFDKIYGAPIFQYLAAHPDKARVFDEAMVGVHGQETAAMLAAYDFAGITTLADVGGGNGSLLSAVLAKHPRLKGMLVDRPDVIPRARELLTAAGVIDRCQLVGGNFFESVPAGADAYLMRHIIHDWEDAKSTLILQNIRQVLPAGGRVLLVEGIVEPGNEPSFIKSLDLTMLLMPGGQERTAEEYKKLLAGAGLRLDRIVPTTSDVSVIESAAA
ncbi:MAG TPA: methyltransferase [Pirellulales bacterium]|nr:methyltransferase [Pirellulales bacterium]